MKNAKSIEFKNICCTCFLPCKYALVIKNGIKHLHVVLFISKETNQTENPLMGLLNGEL